MSSVIGLQVFAEDKFLSHKLPSLHVNETNSLSWVQIIPFSFTFLSFLYHIFLKVLNKQNSSFTYTSNESLIEWFLQVFYLFVFQIPQSSKIIGSIWRDAGDHPSTCKTRTLWDHLQINYLNELKVRDEIIQDMVSFLHFIHIK